MADTVDVQEDAQSSVPVIDTPYERPRDHEPSLNKYFKACIKMKVSDLHLKADKPPMVRSKGDLRLLTGGPLSDDQIRNGILELLNDDQKALFKKMGAIDFAHDVGVKGDADRFRVNAFLQRGKLSVAARRVSRNILTFDQLYLPASMVKITEFHQGMVLLAGITGSGKSTTIAAMIDYINQRDPVHIVTIEDPIEFIHRHQNCMINQREVGADTQSFTAALKYALRQDPDVILIGEMRDLETIAAALTIAETGHLVFATLHTNSAAESINRIIDAFPAHQQGQIRAQLAFVLEGVVTQTLIPRAKGKGRVAAAEIMICTPAIRAVIRDEKIHQIYSLMQAGKKHGMQTMNDALQMLYMKGDVTLEEALKRSGDPNELLRAVGEKVPGDD